jgi:signal transduction histidine kinase
VTRIRDNVLKHRVPIDLVQLQQVFMNLMLTAIEAMQPARRNCSRHGEIRYSATFVVGVATIRS